MTATTPPEWAEQMISISEECSDALPRCGPAECIWDLHGALAASGPIAGITLPDAGELWGLLKVRAFESAILAFMDKNSGFMLSRGASGLAMASVVLPGRAEVTREGQSLALALVSAIAVSVSHDPVGLQEPGVYN